MTKPTTEADRAGERPLRPVLAAAPAVEPPPGVATAEPAVDADGTVSLDETWLGKIAATDALFVTDDKQRVRAWSNAAQRMLGYSSDQVVGQLCYDVVMGSRPDGHPVCGTSCPVTRNARRGRGTASYTILAVARDGSPRYLDNTVLVLERPGGSFRVVHLLRESCDTPPARPSKSTSNSATPVAMAPLAEPLTRRELEVLRFFARGATLEDVACELSISEFTARNHATNIEHKLGVRNRLQMVLEGMRRGLV
jgi:DNA-binding CsgD family transcriptional regulator